MAAAAADPAFPKVGKAIGHVRMDNGMPEPAWAATASTGRPFGRPGDVDVRYWWEADLRVLGVVPGVVTQGAGSEVSSIWHGGDPVGPGQSAGGAGRRNWIIRCATHGIGADRSCSPSSLGALRADGHRPPGGSANARRQADQQFRHRACIERRSKRARTSCWPAWASARPASGAAFSAVSASASAMALPGGTRTPVRPSSITSRKPSTSEPMAQQPLGHPFDQRQPGPSRSGSWSTQ